MSLASELDRVHALAVITGVFNTDVPIIDPNYSTARVSYSTTGSDPGYHLIQLGGPDGSTNVVKQGGNWIDQMTIAGVTYTTSTPAAARTVPSTVTPTIIAPGESMDKTSIANYAFVSSLPQTTIPTSYRPNVAAQGLDIGGIISDVGHFLGIGDKEPSKTGKAIETFLQDDCAKLLPLHPIQYQECKKKGGTGVIEGISQVLPGMQSGEAGTDQFGRLVKKPVTRQRNIRLCGRGFVLGKNGLCYAKGTLPRNEREWKPQPRPPLTGADARAIRRAAAAKKRVRKLGSAVGLHLSSSKRVGKGKRK